MVKKCIVTGKKVTVGNRVSHSNRHVKRRLFPNLQKRRLLDPKTKKMVVVHITSKGLRTLKKWQREGKLYDLNALVKNA